ncbi:MAG TPA: hypothetical protein VE442_23280 [Jatrophihabitans sp.]|nr:hypothetical protein [Jatrophihabitans sp.]
MDSVGAVIVVAVVASRLVVPLFIPRFPLSAILAALVIDGIDQTVFKSVLSASDWAKIANGYQGYDKALDVYYLTVAYTATMRNWTNIHALRWAEGLWLYRLSGVTLFEVLHNAADPDSWRWLLFVFPNTFEYFFIAYEIVRLRWDPRRLSPRFVAWLVAFIWVVIKLPQEWWIHIAQLDFTDFAAEHTWVWPTLGVLLVVAIPTVWWVVAHRLRPADWRMHIAADPLPAALDTEEKRTAYRAATWHGVDANLIEKVVLTSLVCVIFGEILPRNTASAAQLAVVVSVVVVLNSVTSLAFSRRSIFIERVPIDFLAVVVLNVLILVVLRAISARFVLDHALFFALLISLIVVLYDRYRPVRDYRVATASTIAADTPSGAPPPRHSS